MRRGDAGARALGTGTYSFPPTHPVERVTVGDVRLACVSGGGVVASSRAGADRVARSSRRMEGCPRGALCLLVPDAIDYITCTTYPTVSLSLPSRIYVTEEGRTRSNRPACSAVAFRSDSVLRHTARGSGLVHIHSILDFFWLRGTIATTVRTWNESSVQTESYTFTT